MSTRLQRLLRGDLPGFESPTCHIIGTAAAIIGGALLSAGGAAAAGSKASKATKKASKTAAAEQDKALEQQKQLSQPYRDLGTANIPTYQNLLTGDPATQQKTLESLPGYQFTKNQGIENTSRALGAQGFNLSGQQAKGLADYTTGLADQTYSQRLNELLAPVQLGQAAAAGQAANVGAAGTNKANIAINQGNTTAGIAANTIAGVAGAVTNAGNQLITNRTLEGLKMPGGAGGYTYGGGYAKDPGGTSSALMAAPDVPTYGMPVG